jgi:hypothetical protein
MSMHDNEILDQKNIAVIKNALDLIYLTGLLQVEIVNLNVEDVEHNGSIVNSIPPVNLEYPSSFRKEPIPLSNEAFNILAAHINLIKTLNQYSPKGFPLFPNLVNTPRYNIQNLWHYFKKYSLYSSYNRHSEAGILCFCWKKFSLGISNERIIIETYDFSRYASLKKTKKLFELGISRDCNVYETDYKNAVEASKTILRYHITRPDSLKIYLTNLEKSLLHLDEQDRAIVLIQANKKLNNSGKRISWKGTKLCFEENIEYRVPSKSIKMRLKKSN